jgi:GH15 family glucan-1,4-alpha-glucosidase
MDAVYLHSKYRHAVAHRRWEQIKSSLAWLAKNWNQPDEGIWEVRGGHRHFLHSRLMCWVAFDRGIRLAHKRSLSAPLDQWYVQRDMILADIYTNFWNQELGAFVQSKGSEALDASVLLMPLMRIISPVDPMWLSTLNAIEKSLAEGALVYRYRNSQTGDGLEGEEGSFTCCSFWFVECLARAGQIEKARRLFDKLLGHANHLGLFSEQIGRSGHQLGNFPQALTHLALISAATYLDRGLSGQPPKPWG